MKEASFGGSLKEAEELQGKQKSIERDIDSYKSQVIFDGDRIYSVGSD